MLGKDCWELITTITTGRRLLFVTTRADKEANPSSGTTHKFFDSAGSERVDYASPFRSHGGADTSHAEAMTRYQNKLKYLEDDLFERWTTSQERLTDMESKVKKLWDRLQERDQERIRLNQSLTLKADEIMELTKSQTMLKLQ